MNVKTLLRWIDGIDLRAGRVTWLTLVLVPITAGDVLMRYLFNTGTVFNRELEWHLFGVVFLLGEGYTPLCDARARLDIFYAKLPTRAKAWIDFVGTLVFLLPTYTIIIRSSQKFALNSWVARRARPIRGNCRPAISSRP